VKSYSKEGDLRTYSGNGAVFVVKVDRFYEPPQPANYNANRDQMISSFRARMAKINVYGIAEKANIKDNRILYF
jgi:hypothetical protein